jgi:hypothetical protein
LEWLNDDQHALCYHPSEMPLRHVNVRSSNPVDTPMEGEPTQLLDRATRLLRDCDTMVHTRSVRCDQSRDASCKHMLNWGGAWDECMVAGKSMVAFAPSLLPEYVIGNCNMPNAVLHRQPTAARDHVQLTWCRRCWCRGRHWRWAWSIRRSLLRVDLRVVDALGNTRRRAGTLRTKTM